MSEKKSPAQINIWQAQSILDSMQLAFQQLNALLERYGIRMYIYKVKLYSKEAKEHKPLDEDCPDAAHCIDYIVRIKCDSEYVANQLRQSIKESMSK